MRLTLSTACVAFALIASSAGAQESDPDSRPPGPGTRVRGANESAKVLLATAVERSPTVRRLVAALEESDLILLISVDPPAPGQTLFRHHGSVRLLGSAGGQRYAAIWIDSMWYLNTGWRCHVPLLAHELQHALELAGAPRVIDQAGMVALFTRIGSQVGPRHFETKAAIAVESRVREELAISAQPSNGIPARSELPR